MLTMDAKSIAFVFVSVSWIGNIAWSDDVKCLDFSYCKLIKGDIARESEKYNNDPAKFYQEAEEGVTLYKKFLQTQDIAVKEECDRIEESCRTEVAKMAVEDLKFPTKYQDSCNYHTYSRTFFDCKNIKSWPQSVKDHLTKSSKSCRGVCIIIEDTNLTLSTGKVINTFSTDLPPSGDPEVDAMGLETRELDSNRPIVSQMSAFDDDLTKPGWKENFACPENTWAIGVGHLIKGDSLNYVPLICGGFNKTADPKISSVDKNGYVQTAAGYTPKQEGDHPTKWELVCEQRNSFIAGISLNTKQYKTYGKIPLFVNYICASGGWVYPRGTNYSQTAEIPDSKEILCPLGTAICSIHYRFATVEGVLILIDLRMGCCAGDPKYPNLFQTQSPPTTTPTTTSGGLEDLSNLQKRSDYYLFWDESEVLNDIITRYNIYYSPAQIDNEGVDVESTCKPKPGFISSYELRDPKSCYFQGRRIPEIKFNCTSNGQKGDVLDIYGRLKTGHTLQDSKYFQANSCVGGFYTGMEFTYYVVKEYPYLVNAWGVKFKCSVGTTSTDQESVMKAYERLDLATLNPVKANANCDAGKAICGFQNKIEHQHLGAFEGFYFKVLCCTIPT